ncbi:F0F1 ATP synthase subunit gamma [Spirosoma sp. SC4-14]|uniref:F0F1 ATP synthase subunit gamma n=1 Tax=Spirosoma sp. SC4-14 TaxID=3128900 RepID=UPI0030CF6BDB
MSETIEGLRRRIDGASSLASVVHAMKSLAASNIGQYERSVAALADYYRAITLGLTACLRQANPPQLPNPMHMKAIVNEVVVFGSDQGLVGRFNETIADHVLETIGDFSGKVRIWTVGEMLYRQLQARGKLPETSFAVPLSVGAITPLVGQLLFKSQLDREQTDPMRFYLFHNQPTAGASYEPVHQQLLPLDNAWWQSIKTNQWPTRQLPGVLGDQTTTLKALIGEFLFVSIFKACAESLASENASRLAAMERAEKKLNESLEQLNQTYHRLRQTNIDEELFDVLAGFEALVKP